MSTPRPNQFIAPDTRITQEDMDILRGIYPNLSDEEVKAAAESLDRYFAVILRIVKRLESESRESAHNEGVDLT